ncbi:hypothetical protein KPL74_20605 [Bacillus sp. NP157]|nr:hypothetical protein KPL74_20605 [Bacillus sp. NP157]
MADNDTPVRDYTRPPILRGVDPQRMNWLWQLILQATDLKPDEVRAALNAIGVGATDQRIASWSVSDREDNYFPLNIAELERNLRAVIAHKKVAQAGHAAQAESQKIADASAEPDANTPSAPDA